jgi:thioredoxin-related protein
MNMKSMRYFSQWGVIGLFALSAFLPAQAAEFFNQTFGNYAEELADARDEGKQGVFVFFEMDDCPFCHRMKETILQEADVQAYFHAHFKTLRLDIEGANPVVDFDGTEYSEKDMAEKKYRVRATPVMIIFDLEGKPIARYTGPTSSKEEFLLFGKFVVEGGYKSMPFTRYKRENLK